MKRIKWIKNGVTFNRGNHRPLIAYFNNGIRWLEGSAMMTTSTFKAEIAKVARYVGATTVEVKYKYDDDDHLTEPSEGIVEFLDLTEYGKGYKFRRELSVPDGCRRQFKEYKPTQIFKVT